MSTLANCTVLSPIKVELLIYLYCVAVPIDENCRRFDATAPSVVNGLIDLGRAGLIAPDPKGPLGKYIVTARGVAHIDALCSLALPEPAWVSPAAGLTGPGSYRARGELFRVTKDGTAIGFVTTPAPDKG